jgi:trans-aconitate methyltransferase
MGLLFSQLSRYYDAIYYKADVYEAEAETVSRLIRKHKRNQNRRLLDVACGTGTHIKFFLGRHQVSGLDLSEEMLDLAREQYPDVDFHNLSMVDFELDERFGSILCLYGSIAFVQTVENLQTTLRTFSNHLDPGGVLVLTPWSSKEEFKEAVVSDRVKRGDIQVARMEKVERSGEGAVRITYHYLIAEGLDVRYYMGQHPPIGLFSLNEYEEAIRRAGLDVVELYRGKEIQMGMAYVCRKGEGPPG